MPRWPSKLKSRRFWTITIRATVKTKNPHPENRRVGHPPGGKQKNGSKDLPLHRTRNAARTRRRSRGRFGRGPKGEDGGVKGSKERWRHKVAATGFRFVASREGCRFSGELEVVSSQKQRTPNAAIPRPWKRVRRGLGLRKCTRRFRRTTLNHGPHDRNTLFAKRLRIPSLRAVTVARPLNAFTNSGKSQVFDLVWASRCR